MKNVLLIAACLLLGALLPGSVFAKGDATRGKHLVYTCHGCHGIPGYERAYPHYRVPRIVGQNYEYLKTALHEYRDGNRSYPTMHVQALSLSDQEIDDIATYLSSIKPESTEIATTHEVTAELDTAQVCAACHGKHGNAPNPQYPKLAGQWQSYLLHALMQYKSGERSDPIMKGFVSTLSKEDMRELAAYFAGLPGQLDSLDGYVQGDD